MTSVFASTASGYDSNATIVSIRPFYDYTTGYALFTTSNPRVNGILTSSSKALNCFTGGSFYSGCSVTTYSWSGSQYMVWRERQAAVSGATQTYINTYTPGNERTYSLQIRRLGTYPEVNIATLVGNYANDVRVYQGYTTYLDPLSVGSTYNSGPAIKIAVTARLNYGARYISIGGQISGYPGNYCSWNSSGSTFYCVTMNHGDLSGWSILPENS